MEFTKDIKFNINPTVNEDLAITYNGFLVGSENVFIVYGYGENWEHTEEKKMSKTDEGFTVQIKLLDFDTFNFCFRNSNNAWDNNCYCNYITPVKPAKSLDINALIEEILQPVVLTENIEPEMSSVQVTSTPIDLGEEINKALAKIDETAYYEEPSSEYSTIEEILACEVISSEPVVETPVFDLEEQTQNIQAYITESITRLVNPIKNEKELATAKAELTEKILESEGETSLVTTKNKFVVSSRKLKKFHLFKKRIKLALYKAFVKLPKLLLGLDED